MAKIKVNKGLYHPTKDKILNLNERCFEIDCSKFKCSVCRVSNSYQKLTGLRIEEVAEYGKQPY